MAETKFTPGPWTYRPMEFDDWGYVRGPVETDGSHTFICQARDMRATEEDENKARRNGTDPWAANAHLIAAAPDLYAALEFLLSCYRYGAVVSGKEKAVADAVAALRKARGEV